MGVNASSSRSSIMAGGHPSRLPRGRRVQRVLEGAVSLPGFGSSPASLTSAPRYRHSVDLGYPQEQACLARCCRTEATLASSSQTRTRSASFSSDRVRERTPSKCRHRRGAVSMLGRSIDIDALTITTKRTLAARMAVGAIWIVLLVITYHFATIVVAHPHADPVASRDDDAAASSTTCVSAFFYPTQVLLVQCCRCKALLHDPAGLFPGRLVGPTGLRARQWQ